MTPTETVFIVDDDATFARGLSRLVRAAGWNPEVFSSAAEFLAHGGRCEDGPGCVILDVKMPGMKGPELHRTMLGRGMSLPVIFLTGHGDIPTSVDAMKLGAVDFLEKPVPGQVIVRAVRAALDRHADALRRESERSEVESRLARLSPREREVMTYVIAGRLNKQIAADLGISVKTVKAHRAKVMEKMVADSLAALVDLCRVAGVGQRAQGRPT
ncbi:MAG TPA: response regulator [Usitatibacter sp.]|nr:response regulator [Usitatibacter sp.]